MAQKMASSRAKKVNKKAAGRKAAHPTPTAKASAKPKRKAGAVKVQTKLARKPAPVKQKRAAPPVKAPATKRAAEAQTARPAEAARSSAPAAKATAPAPAAKAAPAKAAAPAKHAAPVVPRSAAAPASARAMPAAVAKTAGQKIISPPSMPPPAPAPAADKVEAPKKPVHQRHGFKIGEWIVYPAHGVGRIVTIEEQEIAGITLELFVITFEKDKMTLRVPTGKSQSVGMRKLADEPTVKKAMETLRGRARVKRTMWSRRAQEYEAKINSGDLVAIAEVVRDLYRSESQPEQSYSERQLYEAALDRMAREIAVVEKLDERGATQRITEVLAKSARGRRLAAEEAETKAA
jgi:CarD family transcriptional regulator, regulator of rRNA transcription